MSDDGVHTYIDWPANTALPAVYAVDATGRESLVNGSIRGGVYVVDSIERRFIFRLDRKRASADRILSKARAR